MLMQGMCQWSHSNSHAAGHGQAFHVDAHADERGSVSQDMRTGAARHGNSTPVSVIALPVPEARLAPAQGVCTPGPEHAEGATRPGEPPACPYMGTRTRRESAAPRVPLPPGGAGHGARRGFPLAAAAVSGAK